MGMHKSKNSLKEAVFTFLFTGDKLTISGNHTSDERPIPAKKLNVNIKIP